MKKRVMPCYNDMLQLMSCFKARLRLAQHEPVADDVFRPRRRATSRIPSARRRSRLWTSAWRSKQRRQRRWTPSTTTCSGWREAARG